MKILNLFIALFAVSITTFAQSPNSINYQAVLRDDGSALISDQNVGVQITILSGSISGTQVYKETHATSTNANGLMSIAIGAGSSADDFSSIDWSNGPYFIKTEADPSGGSNYTVTGTSQMMSVPYALYAKTSGSSITTAQAQAIEDNTLDIVDAFTKISANETDIATNAGDISDLIDGQDLQNNAIALNTTKVGITSEQASAILANREYVTNVETDLNELKLEIGSLPDGYIFLGNANGVTEAVQVQGDATIGSNGVSITADAINTAKILNETILNEDIAANAAIDQSKIAGLSTSLTTISQDITNNTTRINDAIAGAGLETDGTYVPGSKTNYINAETSLASALEVLDDQIKTNESSAGLVSITEGSNTGYRRADASPDNYGDIGANAIDLSTSFSNSSTLGATGNNSVAMGYETTASDYGSVVMGQYNSEGSTVTMNASSFDLANTALVIGNGTDAANPSDAFKVFFSGDATLAGNLDVTNGIVQAQAFVGDGSGLWGVGGPNGTTFGQIQVWDGSNWTVSGNKLAIGNNAGSLNQGSDAVAIGTSAGNENQGERAIAIGFDAGYEQGNNSVAIGTNAGYIQGIGAIAIGNDDAGYEQGNYSIAIGEGAGYFNDTALGEYSIAIGYQAAYNEGSDYAIILNATGAALDIQKTGLYIAPIDADENTLGGDKLLKYNTTTNEITYASAGASAGINAGDVTTTEILNGTIVNEDIATNAAIAQSKIDGLTTALAGKQNTIADGGLTIAKTNGLQTALDAKASLTGATFTGAVSATSFTGDGSGLTGINSGAFSTASNVTSNSGGALATDDFVFGSSQLKNDNTTTDDDSRMYYDKSKGAFRAGAVDGDQWDEAGVGDYSVAMGFNSEANGLYSVGMGFNAAASGESAIAIGRFSIASGTGSFAVGADATSNPGIGPKASNRGSIAMGVNTISSGEAAVATGFGSSASGFSSFAIGEETVASGDNSFAGGYGSQATRSESVAIGMQANANADKSVAIGNNVAANTFNEVVFGRYNTTATLNKTSWSASNPLFTVGNGSGTNNTNNAFQILKNGDASLDGTLTANAFVGNGSGLTGVTASVSLAEGDVTTTEILNSTILNEDISATAAIAQSKISGLSSSFDAKQDLISDGDLSIANTSGLQAVLDTKAPLESPLFNNPTLTGVVSLNSAAIQLVGETDTDGKILISDSNGFLLLESPSFASGNSSGIVSDNTQSFGGNKTFVSAVNVEGTFNAKSNAFVDGDLKADRYVMTAAGAASGAAIMLNLSTANLFTINVDQDITSITLTNAAVGTYIIKFQRDTVGNRAIALPSEWKWSGGSTPTITQVGSALDIVTLIYDGTNYYAAISQDF